MEGQTYATHRYTPTFWLIVALSALIVLVLMLVNLVRQPSLLSTALLLQSFAVVCALMLIRRFALKLQDRIIRLEMQTRMTRLGRAADCDRLSQQQIIALRFASDAEIATLLDKCLADKLEPDQIKRAVTNWQGDYMRT